MVAVPTVTLTLSEMALSRRALQAALLPSKPVAAVEAGSALQAVTGSRNLAALASPLTYRERACGAGAEAEAGAAQALALALALWLAALAVVVAAVRHRSAQTER